MEELDLKEIFESFYKKKSEIFLIFLIFLTIGVVYTKYFVVPEYTASTTLVLVSLDNASITSADTNPLTATDLTMNSQLVSTYSELVKSKNIVREVIQNLDLDVNEDEIRKNVSVNTVANTELIEIKVNNKNGIAAANIANELARIFTKKVSEIYNINNVYILDVAEPQTVPSNINHVKDIVMFGCVGLIMAFGYGFISNIMTDRTIKTADDVEKILAIPVLAEITTYTQVSSKRNSKKEMEKKR